MAVNNQTELLLRLMKDVNDIRSALRRTVANLPLYDIANENTPAQLTSDQNDYAPGNYDILRLSSDATRSITGIRAGVKGRRLQLFNVGDFAITLSQQSSLSGASNRFSFVNQSDFIIPPDGNVLLYYDSSQQRWIGGDQASVFDIVNESSPVQITEDQNDYDPGLAEVLRLSTDAARTITGISGGVKGRYLQIINAGNFNITLAYESALSSANNRFITPSAERTVLYPRASVRLYYDGVSLRWSIPDAPTWMGTYGKTVILSASASQSVPDNTTTKITCLDTVISDEWGMWSVANQKITIPETGIYLGTIWVQFPGNGAGPGLVRAVSWQKSGSTVGIIQVPPCGFPVATDITTPLFYKFSVGDTVEMYALQDRGSSMNVDVLEFAFTRVH